MDPGRGLVFYLLPALIVGFGIYGFIRGKITYGPEGGSPEDDRILIGKRARLIAALIVVSGVVLFFHTTIGLCMVAGVLFLPWVLGE